MERRKLILIYLLCVSIVLSISAINVKAQTGTYTQRVSQSNPFTFSVNTIYIMDSTNYRMQNDSFHQAYLNGGNYYVFYIKSSLVSYNLTVWIQISDESESFYREDCGDGEFQLLMLFKPQKTGLYNIIMSNRNYDTVDDLYFKIDEIGILEIPEYTFDYNSDLDRYEVEILENWNSEYVVCGIVHLNKSLEYKIQGGYKIYKGYLSQYSISSVKLDGKNSYEELYTEDDILNISSESDYLFYELLGNPFWIYYQEIETTPDTPKISGFSILISGVIIIGIILILMKKFHEKSNNNVFN